MDEKSSRRRVLGVVAGATASLAGCASIATDERATDTVGPRTTSEEPGTEPATATPEGSATSGPEETATSSSEDSTEWSVEDVTVDSPSVSFGGVQIPSTRGRYATMGADDADATATLFGSWKCPYTQDFVLNGLPEVVERYVEPGDLRLTFRSVAYRGGEPFLGPDAPRAARAGLAVWDIDPRAFWSYFATVFTNQPQERYDWAQPSLLERFAAESGVRNRAELERRVTGDRYRAAVEATTTAAADLGVSRVPRIAVEGALLAPTVDFEGTLAHLDSVVES